MSDKPKNLTDEVRAAMEAQGIAPLEPPPPPPPPEGHVRYSLSVGETHIRGAAPINIIAAQLRQLADQIESSSKGANDG